VRNLRSELFADNITGKLYYADVTDYDVDEFDPVGGERMQMDWHSKEFVIPKPVNLGAAKVNFTARYTVEQLALLQAIFDAAVAVNNAILDAGTEGGLIADTSDTVGELEVCGDLLTAVVNPELESPTVMFTLYVDGVEKYAKVVSDIKGFALPSGYKSDTFSVRVQGQSLVKSIDIAETFAGLSNV